MLFHPEMALIVGIVLIVGLIVIGIVEAYGD